MPEYTDTGGGGFKEVILDVGGNDCSTKVDVDVLMKQYEEVINSLALYI